MQVEVGKIVEGKVAGITNFGAFIRLPDGNTGLVHISEVAEEYVKDINTHLKENQLVKVKVLSLDRNGKISLSIKKAAEPRNNAIRTARPENFDWNHRSSHMDNTSFEDRLARFLKDSEEKLQDLKKNVESKRGSGSFKKMAHF